MSSSEQQRSDWFAEAAELAWRGQGLVEPNPLVGALALHGDEIVGRGWHGRFGGPHAEEAALLDARAQGREVDALVVTLEPCSTAQNGTDKRRPACTDLIREAGLRRIYVGMLDPDPRHAGAGLRILRDAGIQVEGPERGPALEGLLSRFEQALRLDRPWVQAKWAMTLDGKTASRTGSSRWISGEVALRHAHELRAAADAVMVGMGTVLADDPSLDVRHCEGPDPIALVIDPRGELPLSSRLVQRARESQVWLLVSSNCPPDRIQALEQKGVEVIAGSAEGSAEASAEGSVAGDAVDLKRALRTLRQRGVRRLLVEGGGKLVGRLFDEELLDQCEAILAPKLIGGAEAPGPMAGRGLAEMEAAIPLEDHYTRGLGDCLLLGGYPRFPESQG